MSDRLTISSTNLILNLKCILDKLHTNDITKLDNIKSEVISLINHIEYCNKVSSNRKQVK